MYEYNIQIDKLCQKLHLGDLVGEPTQMPLGFSHKMFAVTTTKAQYAVKALNPCRMCNVEAQERIETSEKVSRLASNYIAAVCAFLFNGHVLQELDGQYYIIYEYINGDTLDSSTISTVHCERMGEILARLHSIDFSELAIKEELEEERVNINWNPYIQQGKQQNAAWCKLLEENSENLSRWYQKGIVADELLKKNRQISHRNMDPRNVIWVKDQPMIIDWEESDYIHPYYDFIHTAILWSKGDVACIDKERLLCFVKGYQRIKPMKKIHWENILYREYLESIEWLEYCVKQSLGVYGDNPQVRQSGSNSVFYMINKDIVPYEKERNKLLELLADIE